MHAFHLLKYILLVSHLQKEYIRKKKSEEGRKYYHKSYFSWLCFIENSARRLNINENCLEKETIQYNT